MPAFFVLPTGSSTLILEIPSALTGSLEASNQVEKSDPQPIRGIDPSKLGGAQNPAGAGGDNAAPGTTPAAPTGSTTSPTDPKGGAAPQDSLAPCLSSLPLIIGMFALMYLLVIRPQQKQERQRRALLAAIKKGDKVVTTGGIHGEVESIDEHTVTIRCGGGDGYRLKMDRAAIGRLQGADGEGGGKDSGGSKA